MSATAACGISHMIDLKYMNNPNAPTTNSYNTAEKKYSRIYLTFINCTNNPTKGICLIKCSSSVQFQRPID